MDAMKGEAPPLGRLTSQRGVNRAESEGCWPGLYLSMDYIYATTAENCWEWRGPGLSGEEGANGWEMPTSAQWFLHININCKVYGLFIAKLLLGIPEIV